MTSRIYFPLQSSVEFFADPTQATAVARAKEGAVLFEEIFFEDGQMIATVGGGMNVVIRRPRHQLTEEDLNETLPPAAAGESMMVAVGTETTPGASANQMQSIGETVVQSAYVAQWHSAAIDELGQLNVPWAGIAAPSDEQLAQLAAPITAATGEFTERGQTTDLSRPQIDFAAKSLARDAVFAAVLGASINVSPMFKPMVEGGGAETQATGSDALAFMVPNIEHLPWESIAEFRERPGSVEARGLLREVEEKALSQEAGDAEAYLETVKALITDGLAAALLETEVNLPKVLAREAVTLAVSFVPIVGAGIGTAAGIAAALGEKVEQRESGLLALVKLRQVT
jgi:hypothetical protein